MMSVNKTPEVDSESLGKLRALDQHGKLLLGRKPDPEDLFSIGSVSPSPVKEAQLTGDTKDTRLMELIAGQSLNRSGVLTHLQLASPLESVRELLEVEDMHELKTPGEQMEGDEIFPSTTTTIKYMPLNTEGLDHAFGPVAMESTTDQPDLAHLEEACSSVHKVPSSLWLGEDSSKISVKECQQVDQCSPAACGDQTEASRQQLTPSSANSGALEAATPLPDLLNPAQEEQKCHQYSAEVEAKLDDVLRLGCKQNSVEFPGQMEDTATNVANQSRIEVLTSCNAKAEQTEQLRSSSFDLSAQLRSAQILAASLHQRVLCLEQEHSLKDQELQALTASLEKTSEALEARNSETASIAKELHQLHLDVEAKKCAPSAARAVTANGQTPPDWHQQSDRSSKLCTLL